MAQLNKKLRDSHKYFSQSDGQIKKLEAAKGEITRYARLDRKKRISQELMAFCI